MARLKKAEKVFIVRSLAQFMTPTEVVVAIKENFKIDVTPQQVEAYDPTKTAGADLSQEFVDLFHEARKKYIDQFKSSFFDKVALCFSNCDKFFF